jgi:hypothetical protein
MAKRPYRVTWNGLKLGFEKDELQLNPDNLINLLNVYGTQFGSYTTLLWQVPALSLTAQSFLLTIALGSDTANFARIIVAALSMIIVIASYSLMHEQRGHALSHGEVAAKIAEQLKLDKLVVDVDDSVPPRPTDAADLWREQSNRLRNIARAGILYNLWRITILLFFAADVLILISASRGYAWFGHSS